MFRKTQAAYMDFFSQPASLLARIVLVVSIIAVFFAFRYPLWTMSFRSNQYPDPLRMSIFVNHLEGQKTADRDDLREINSLNHYIGMRPILESDFAEFTWLPFIIGGFALLILRALLLGRIRDLVDIFVMYIYFGLFSAWDFYNKLYNYGHNLDPKAAITVTGFTPPFYGEIKIANFWVASYPAGGSFALGAWGALMFLALALAVWASWKAARLKLGAAEEPAVAAR
jgi:copper chaperone NosL